MNDLLNITFVINLALSVLNVILYMIGYKKVTSAQVDGKLKMTKRVILFELISVAVFALLQAVIYATVVFASQHTTQALYLENVAILFFNIAFTANAFLLALIVEVGSRKNV